LPLSGTVGIGRTHSSSQHLIFLFSYLSHTSPSACHTILTIHNSLALLLPRRRLDGCSCKSPLAHFYLYQSDTSVRQLHPFTTITHLASQNTITPTDQDSFPIQFLFRKQTRSDPSPSAETGDKANDKADDKGDGKGNDVTHKRASGFKLIWDLLQKKARPGAGAEWTDRLASLADAPITNLTPPHPSPATSPANDSSSISWFGPYHPSHAADIGVRCEGPYFTPADVSKHHTVVCLVAGTGVSGAIAIVGAFNELQRQRAVHGFSSPCNNGIREQDCGGRGCEREGGQNSAGDCGVHGGKGKGGGGCEVLGGENEIWQRCVVVWSVREGDYIDLPFLRSEFIILPFAFLTLLQQLKLTFFLARHTEENRAPNLEVRICLTGKDRPRVDMEQVLADIKAPSASASKSASASASLKASASGSAETKTEGKEERTEKEGTEKVQGVTGGTTPQPSSTDTDPEPQNPDSIWVYLSGPNKFIDAGEAACKATKGVEWFGARWEI